MPPYGRGSLRPCRLLKEDATSRSIAPATGDKTSLPTGQLCPLHKGGFAANNFMQSATPVHSSLREGAGERSETEGERETIEI